MSKFNVDRGTTQRLQDFNRFNKHQEVEAFKSELSGGGESGDVIKAYVADAFKNNYRGPSSQGIEKKAPKQGFMVPQQQDTTPNQLVQSLQDRQEEFMGDPTVKQKVLGV